MNKATVDSVMEFVRAVRVAVAVQIIEPCEANIGELEIADAALRAEVERLAAQAAVPAPDDADMVLAPPWRGYALLGTGNYVLNSSAAPPDPKLGAEFFITFATDADKSGNRQVGESRANNPNAAPVQPEEMVLRIGFLTPQALSAMEDQLRVLREENFPESVAQPPAQAEPAPAPVGEYPPLPKPARQGPWPGDPAYFIERQMHAYLDADRAQRPDLEVRLLTRKETRVHFDGVETSRDLDPDDIQRKFCEVNGLTIKEQS